MKLIRNWIKKLIREVDNEPVEVSLYDQYKMDQTFQERVEKVLHQYVQKCRSCRDVYLRRREEQTHVPGPGSLYVSYGYTVQNDGYGLCRSCAEIERKVKAAEKKLRAKLAPPSKAHAIWRGGPLAW